MIAAAATFKVLNIVAPLLGWRINGNLIAYLRVIKSDIDASPLYWGGELMETKAELYPRPSCRPFIGVAPLLGWRINGNPSRPKSRIVPTTFMSPLYWGGELMETILLESVATPDLCRESPFYWGGKSIKT